MAQNGTPETGGRDRQIARLVASGIAHRIVAQRLNVSRRTVERRLAIPAVRAMVDRFRDEMFASGLGLLAKKFHRAVEIMVDLAESGTPRDHVRLTAASRLVESAMKTRESVDLAERIAALVARPGR